KRVAARVSRRVGVREELLGQVDLEPGLFFHLTHASRVQRLAFVDEAPRQRPAQRRVLAPNQHDAIARQLDDAVDGRHRVLEGSHAAWPCYYTRARSG